MTGNWLTLTKAAARISRAAGRSVSMDDIIRLGETSHPTRTTVLTVQFMHGHYTVLEESVDRLLASPELGAVMAALEADKEDKPAFTPWSRADDPEAFADRADHDTPNDEGDEHQ